MDNFQFNKVKELNALDSNTLKFLTKKYITSVDKLDRIVKLWISKFYKILVLVIEWLEKNPITYDNLSFGYYTALFRSGTVQTSLFSLNLN